MEATALTAIPARPVAAAGGNFLRKFTGKSITPEQESLMQGRQANDHDILETASVRLLVEEPARRTPQNFSLRRGIDLESQNFRHFRLEAHGKVRSDHQPRRRDMGDHFGDMMRHQ